ncbi:hypothetical protein [Azospirillum griseum]|uniref:TnsE C-terminal domain-containing protein n=1 Tax=Azospirillum griseum TaxID=2496639 RepID=A0A3S0HWT0_9PROT|nr:hypothetical protein [Azospirillum griseum]RTR12486.1 hypothetical protein EJ903_25350 [Azospirillum griseum]
MPIIQTFKEQGEDLELIWLAGFIEDAERGWLVNAVTRGMTSGRLRMRPVPIGLLPLLAPGRCFVNGAPAHAARRGSITEIFIGDAHAGIEITSDAVPPEMIGTGDNKRGTQRLFRYRWNGMEILVPTTEMVRYFFAHNKTMANALMRPGGLMELCRPEQPGFHPDLHLHFTAKMPLSALKPPFVAEFAWIAVHPEGRRSWDSVAEYTAGQPYVRFLLPRIKNSRWMVRMVHSGNTALVLEILNATGKEHPCDVLRYSHPSMRSDIVSSGEPASDDEDEAPANPRPVREIRDYVVDEHNGATRTDVHQSALPGPAKGSGFDRVIDIVRMTEKEHRATDIEADGKKQGKQPSRTSDPDELQQRRQVRIRASVAEEGFEARLPPIEFELLEPAEPGYTGSLEPLISALHQMSGLVPGISVAMSLCVLKIGRAFSYAGRHRRPCLVAAIWPPSHPPMVLLDVDHADDVALSSLVLIFRRHLPFREMEEPIKALLDGLVTNSGRWNLVAAEPFAGVCDYLRLPRVLRHQERTEQAAYHKAWALRLIDRLSLETA